LSGVSLVYDPDINYGFVTYVLSSTEISVYFFSAGVKTANNEAVARSTIYSCNTQFSINHTIPVA
jgi:hypothetical protein